MGKRRKKADEEDNGFAIWGGYMEAKKTKLMEQFSEKTVKQVEKLSDIFKGIAILVNGYTKPNAEELKIIMAQHGGAFHMYQISSTTHIIASNLPNVKINKLGNVPIVKPGWIEDSITFGRLLDYSKYLLYTNQSKTQPKLNFNVIPKNSNPTSNTSSSIFQNDYTKTFPNSTINKDDFIDVKKENNCDNFYHAHNGSGDVVSKTRDSLNCFNNSDSINVINDSNADIVSDSDDSNIGESEIFVSDKKARDTKFLNDSNTRNSKLFDLKITKTTSDPKLLSINDDSNKSELKTSPNGAKTDSKIFSDDLKNMKTTSDKKLLIDDSNQPELKTCLNDAKIFSDDLKNLDITSDKKLLMINNNSNKSELKTSPNGSKVSKTASDPKFLSEFYNNSRLHLISTLGAEFKQLVNDLREKTDWKFPGLEKITKIKNTKKNQLTIMHIDMDCFFVSVGLRSRPELRGKPVAVTHSKGGQSRGNVDRQAEIAMYKERLPDGADCRLEAIDNTCSLSEIASCSYEARRCGIKNGMFMGAALKLCPELQAIPYDFQGYREVSNTLYRTLAEYTLDIEAVSCDEMYVDVSKILEKSGMGVMEWAEHIRGVIIERTGCPCSTGFGGNRLQARLATKKAKPNGAFYLRQEDVEGYLVDISLAELPGVGRATLHKLKSLGLETCGDVQMTSLTLLKNELGAKAGETIADQARGVDKKPLKYDHERKSVSAEVNYGIRFKTNDEAIKFFESLSQEVKSRLKDVNMKAKCVTLKVMVRAQDAPTETAKYLGHGVCDSLSRSSTFSSATDDAQIIFKEVKNLYDKLSLPFQDLRGVGIQLLRLEKEVAINNVLKSFLSKENIVVKKTQQISKNYEEIPPEVIINERVDVKVKEHKKVNTENKNGIKNSTRGRPKGSKNSKSISKSNGADLSNYFKCTQKDRPAVKAQNLSNSNKSMNIDINVLEQLPPDIRAEIIREYKLNIPSENQLKNETSPINAKTQSEAGSSKEKKNNGIAKPKENKPSFETLSTENFKTMLINWLNSRPKPHDVDVSMLGKHFKSMATNRKIEELHVLLKFLHRKIDEKSNCIWHKVYFQIVQLAQEGMIGKYGGKLLVPIRFNCDECYGA